MTKIACRYCIMQDGLRGADVAALPDADAPDSDALLIEHIESVHHIPVTRADETPEQALARFARDYPDAGGPACRCPSCVRQRGAPT